MYTKAQMMSDISQSIKSNKQRHPLEQVNKDMIAELEDARVKSKTCLQFKRSVMARTGLTSKGFKACQACQWFISQYK